jgi:hypothetical protein
MFCYKCGEEIKEHDKFCEHCGASTVGHVEHKEEKKTDVWKWFGYGWTVIVNLITLGVVVAIYSNIYDSFEIITVSLLILIYLSIQSITMIYGKTTIETVFAYDSEFKRIRKLLREQPDEYEEEEIQVAKKKVGKAMVKMYTNGSFIFIIYLIALWNLFSTL